MNRILLDEKEVGTLVPESLPMLIHGKEGSGASLYTICLAAKWFSQGYKVLFLCGYPMAEQEFAKQAGDAHDNARFFTKEKVEEFKKAVGSATPADTVIMIKNIELFTEDVFASVDEVKNVILSGDVDQVGPKDKIAEKKFTTRVFFSPLGDQVLPAIPKYQGLVVSGNFQGITRVE